MSIIKKLRESFGSSDPNEKAKRLYQKGLKSTEQHRFREAIPVLEQAANLNSDSACVYNVLAYCYSQIAAEYEGNEVELNSWMSKAADTFWKAITLHREHGGLNQTQLTTAMDLVAAVDRINMEKTQSPAEDLRRGIFKEFTSLKDAKSGWQDQAWAIIRGTGPDVAGDLKRVKSEAEEKAITEITRKYKVTERQLHAIVQEAQNKHW